jgi:hypothetical protein
VETNGKKSEKPGLRDRLENELTQVQFDETMKMRVLQRAKRSFWEREIRIPGSAAVAVCLLLVGAGGLWFAQSAKHAPVPGMAGQEIKNETNPSVRSERQFVVLNSGVYSEKILREGWDE